jgi:hypothetical protein
MSNTVTAKPQQVEVVTFAISGRRSDALPVSHYLGLEIAS